jgi:hypothetical protein
VPSESDILTRQLTPAEHIGQAERFANTLLAGLNQAEKAGGLMLTSDIPVYDVYLHAADVHIRLAEAKMRLGQQPYRG